MCKQQKRECGLRRLAVIVGGILTVIGAAALVCTILAKHTQKGRAFCAKLKAKRNGADPMAEYYVN